MALTVTRYADAAAFLDRAGPWLRTSEVEHALMLGIAAEPALGAGARSAKAAERSPYFASADEGGSIRACALRTPPWKALITRGGDEAIHALADDLVDRYGTLPAVLGPEPAVEVFAHRYASVTGGEVRRGKRERLHVLHSVTPPARRAPGQLRQARIEDIALLGPWVTAFFAEIGEEQRVQDLLERGIGDGRLFVWEDGGAIVSMAQQGLKTPTGAGINLVYTPTALRGRGYATTCVAALTQHLLDAGNAYCCLFTDLANPTSNHIYAEIGYRPVCDMSDYLLAEVVACGPG